MIYFIPFMYGIKSRTKTFMHKISFVIIFMLPIYFTSLSACNKPFEMKKIVIVTLGFIAMYCVYEIGYLYNDCFATRFEENPSYWLPSKDRNQVDKNFELLIGTRLLVVILILAVLDYLKVDNLGMFILNLSLTHFVYGLHNRFRGKINIITNGLLQVLKYCAPLLLMTQKEDMCVYVLIIILEVPLIRALEFTRKKRFNLDLFYGLDISVLRVIYHTIVSVAAFIITRFDARFEVLLVVSLILLAFRVISFFALKNNKINEIRSKNFIDVK